MNERLKKLARLGVAAGLAIGGAAQTLEVVHQRQEAESLRQTITEQDLNIKDLQNEECWDFNLIQVLGLRTLGIPPLNIEDCDTTKPKGHPDPTPTPQIHGIGG